MKGFVALSWLVALTTSQIHAQTCSTVQDGNFNAPGTFTCTAGTTSPPGPAFAGTINITHVVTIPISTTITINGLTGINVSGAGKIVMNNGSRLSLTNSGSFISLAAVANNIRGGNNSSSLSIGSTVCNGPFQGGGGGNATNIEGPKTVTQSTGCQGGALPVSLVSFTAKAKTAHSVDVTWTTSFETSNRGFLVERSKDLKAFDKVGEVSEIAANSSAMKTYHITDEMPYTGTSYYRLTQTDLSGKTTEFPVVSVVLREESYGVFPNPVITDGRFSLRLDEPETAVVRFYSADGRSLPLQKTGVQAGNLLLKTTGKLAAGVYLLTVDERGQTRKHRLVVQ